MIKVAVSGALGKMGREVINAVNNCADTTLVAAIDICNVGKDIGELGLNEKNGVIISDNAEVALKNSNADVVVDFTQPATIFENAKKYLNIGVAVQQV